MSHVIGDATAVRQCCCSTSWPPASHRFVQQPLGTTHGALARMQLMLLLKLEVEQQDASSAGSSSSLHILHCLQRAASLLGMLECTVTTTSVT
jgi:hypothetical protein